MGGERGRRDAAKELEEARREAAVDDDVEGIVEEARGVVAARGLEQQSHRFEEAARVAGRSRCACEREGLLTRHVGAPLGQDDRVVHSHRPGLGLQEGRHGTEDARVVAHGRERRAIDGQLERAEQGDERGGGSRERGDDLVRIDRSLLAQPRAPSEQPGRPLRGARELADPPGTFAGQQVARELAQLPIGQIADHDDVLGEIGERHEASSGEDPAARARLGAEARDEALLLRVGEVVHVVDEHHAAVALHPRDDLARERVDVAEARRLGRALLVDHAAQNRQEELPCVVARARVDVMGADRGRREDVLHGRGLADPAAAEHQRHRIVAEAPLEVAALARASHEPPLRHAGEPTTRAAV
jgi:hypothetical protein